MSQARSSLPRTIAAHAALLTYTAIALFPVFVIVINAFKSRRAIFTEPLATANSRSPGSPLAKMVVPRLNLRVVA